MKKKNGYTFTELLIIIIAIGFIAIIGISKVSYAFDNNSEETKEVTKSLVEKASITYAKSKEDQFKKEESTFIFAKEVANAGFLFEKEIYNTMKVKITYDSDTDSFHAEVVA